MGNAETLSDSLSMTDSLLFDFDKFPIQKGSLGPLHIGMTIEEAEKLFTGLIKGEDEAGNFGFDGGEKSYLYYLNKELVFVLIPKLETDTILSIVAIHNNLTTTNGLHPNASVQQIQALYPDMIVEHDLLNGWEIFHDATNQWQFVFITDENERIGDYPDLDAPSKPKRLQIQADWITIF